MVINLKIKKLFLISSAALCFNAQAMMDADGHLMDIIQTRNTPEYKCPPFQDKPILGCILDGIGRSTLMHEYNQKIIAPLYKQDRNSKNIEPYPDTHEYQKMSRFAQTALGIHPKYQLPIKYDKTLGELDSCAAYVKSGYIAINENFIFIDKFVSINNVLRHESSHAANNDFAMERGVILPITTFAAYRILRSLPVRVRFLYPAISILTGIYASNVHNKYAETRADIDGAYASSCYKCAYKGADGSHSVHDTCTEAKENLAQGYLSKEEIMEIAEYLKSQGKICSHHTEQQQLENQVLELIDQKKFNQAIGILDSHKITDLEKRVDLLKKLKQEYHNTSLSQRIGQYVKS